MESGAGQERLEKILSDMAENTRMGEAGQET
jgi:hypothetical protein